MYGMKENIFKLLLSDVLMFKMIYTLQNNDL